MMATHNSNPVSDPYGRSNGNVVDSSTLRKVALGAVAGTVIEWFDFAIYGFLAPYLAAAFFPSNTVYVGLLQVFAVFAVAFALRPLGGAFFGRLGDRIGRKKVLVLTIALMTLGTASIGLIPSHASIGALAAVLLTLARCLQGFSAGGEYAGACTYMVEHCQPNRRARYASLMPAATFGSFALAALISLALSSSMSELAMGVWGWRIPFLVAAPLGLVAFFIRGKLQESPAFKHMKSEHHQTEQESILKILSVQWPSMLRLGGFISLTAVSFYTFSTYMTTFLVEVVGMDSSEVFLSNLLALSAATIMAPIIGRVCDRIKRKATMISACVLLGVLSIPAYLLGEGGTITTAFSAQILLALGAVTANVVTAVLLSEVFPTTVRYTTSAITYNVAYAVFGGTAPFVATLLIGMTGNHLAPAAYIMVIAVIAFIAAILLPETAGAPLDDPLAQSKCHGDDGCAKGPLYSS